MDNVRLIGVVGTDMQPVLFSGDIKTQMPVPTCLELAAGILGSVAYPV